MKLEAVTEAGDARRRLLKLIASCDRFYLASAWVTPSSVFTAAINAKHKLECFVIGTSRYFTDVDCLIQCEKLKQVKVKPPTGRLFHPKLYAFEFSDHQIVYVGSANLTAAGLDRNTECGVFITADRQDAATRDLLAYIRREFRRAEPLTPDFIGLYRANANRLKEARESLNSFVKPSKAGNQKVAAASKAAMNMTWDRYVRRVSSEGKANLQMRLRLLAAARQMYARGLQFKQLSEDERMALAGHCDTAEKGEIEWGYFGRMTRNRNFDEFLTRRVGRISTALDHIPPNGPVLRRHYDRYIKALKTIPGVTEGWIGMGSRLLAMKRPDYFVCITGKNAKGVCANFAAAPTTTNLDNYWERIIEPMSLMPWWQAPFPASASQQEIWLGRAAMLDAIHYAP